MRRFNVARRLLRSAIVLAAALMASRAEFGRGDDDAEFVEKFRVIRWVAYSSPAGNPHKGIAPQPTYVEAELTLLRRAGFTGLVTYTAEGAYGLPLVETAARIGFHGVVVGVWNPKGADEIDAAAACAKHEIVMMYCVGNEGLGKRYSFTELERAMGRLAERTGKRVVTAEESDDYRDERLLKLGDGVFCNAHPYFHGRRDPESAVAWTVRAYADLQARAAQAQTRVLAFKEVGLPTAGDKRYKLSEEAQDRYYRLLEATGVPFVTFEAFDLSWKHHLPIEPHWGVFHSDRSPKVLGRRLLTTYEDRAPASVKK